VRSKPHLARYLGENFDLSAFDFRAGKIVSSSIRKQRRQTGVSFDYARGLCSTMFLIIYTYANLLTKN